MPWCYIYTRYTRTIREICTYDIYLVLHTRTIGITFEMGTGTGTADFYHAQVIGSTIDSSYYRFLPVSPSPSRCFVCAADICPSCEYVCFPSGSLSEVLASFVFCFIPDFLFRFCWLFVHIFLVLPTRYVVVLSYPARWYFTC